MMLTTSFILAQINVIWGEILIFINSICPKNIFKRLMYILAFAYSPVLLDKII